jgi:hypothetical protein
VGARVRPPLVGQCCYMVAMLCAAGSRCRHLSVL